MHKIGSPHELQAALLFLLSRYAKEQRTDMVPAIVDHFFWLAHHPSLKDSPMLRKTCMQLGHNWEDGLYNREKFRFKTPLGGPVH